MLEGESIQARRLRREEERGREANVPEETDAEVGDHSGVSNDRLATDIDLDKPVYLKGLFSVSTTSTKPVREIRTDIKRVLKQLGVDYVEIKGGFNCSHSPSIDLKKVADGLNSPQQTPGPNKRRFSFGGLRGQRPGARRRARKRRARRTHHAEDAGRQSPRVLELGRVRGQRSPHGERRPLQAVGGGGRDEHPRPQRHGRQHGPRV